MICVKLATPATFATPEMPATFVTHVVTRAIIGTLGSRYHPAVRQPGQLPKASRQVQRDSSRRFLGHHPRCPNRLRRLSLHGALSTVRRANCSR